MAAPDDTGLLALTSGIVANYVANNAVRPADLPGLVGLVHDCLRGLGQDPGPDPDSADTPSAAEIRKSVTPEGIVSFLNGKTYQSLKRHLARHALTPEDYRTRFGLPSNYPMTAQAFSARRSALAKAAGLGRGGRRPKSAGGGVGAAAAASAVDPTV